MFLPIVELVGGREHRMDDDDNVNNDDLVLGFSCGGAGGSVFSVVG